MNQDPREPHDIAQQILDDDTDGMEDLLKDTEVEDDSDEEEFEYDIEPQLEMPEDDSDDIEYF